MFFIVTEFALWIILLIIEPIPTIINIIIEWLKNRINKEDNMEKTNKNKNNKKGKGFCICGLLLM